MYSFIICYCMLSALLTAVWANYNGPFIFWGRDELKNYDISALQNLDEKHLQHIYSDASAIMLFIRNASSGRLSEATFPEFRKILQDNSYLYLTQYSLPASPVDFNENAEIIKLVGPDMQQDVELSALYRDSVLTYGEGKVLGILATKTTDHLIRKRQATATGETAPAESADPTSLPEKETEKDANQGGGDQKDTAQAPVDDETFYQYIDPGKAILYTKAPLISDDEIGNLTFGPYILVNGDYRAKDKTYSLHVTYKYNDPRSNSSKLNLIFRFPITNGYWSLNSAEIRDQTRTLHILNVVGEGPTAPIGFSYKCSRALIFRNNSTSLTLRNIQVQAEMNSKTRFGDAYDCVGFTTAPIWSGIFVAFLICFVTALSIHCILEIKPPNRFENNRSKQLIFTVQE